MDDEDVNIGEKRTGESATAYMQAWQSSFSTLMALKKLFTYTTCQYLNFHVTVL